jgi:hypothetical protein
MLQNLRLATSPKGPKTSGQIIPPKTLVSTAQTLAFSNNVRLLSIQARTATFLVEFQVENLTGRRPDFLYHFVSLGAVTDCCFNSRERRIFSGVSCKNCSASLRVAGAM